MFLVTINMPYQMLLINQCYAILNVIFTNIMTYQILVVNIVLTQKLLGANTVSYQMLLLTNNMPYQILIAANVMLFLTLLFAHQAYLEIIYNYCKIYLNNYIYGIHQIFIIFCNYLCIFIKKQLNIDLNISLNIQFSLFRNFFSGKVLWESLKLYLSYIKKNKNFIF